MLSRPGVRERHPLKQGLKQKIEVLYAGVFQVRERHPLKQGLKQITVNSPMRPGKS